MMKNTNVKNNLNKIRKTQIAETLAAVHTHIHTHRGCHLVNKVNVKYAENIKMNIKLIKDRTMLKTDSIGLSLCLFANRDGPKSNIKKLQKGRLLQF